MSAIPRPSMAVEPASRASKPLMDLSSVVLPHPEGPSSVMNSLSPTSRDTPSKAWITPPSGVANRLLASRMDIKRIPAWSNAGGDRLRGPRRDRQVAPDAPARSWHLLGPHPGPGAVVHPEVGAEI